MGFTSILTISVLGIGATFPARVFSLELPRSSSIEHHRTIRMANVCPGDVNDVASGWKNDNGNCFYFSSKTNAAMLNWKKAQAACMKLGRDKSETTVVRLAELGDMDNLKSDDWLMRQISANGVQAWLGAQDTNPGEPISPIDTGTDDKWIWEYSRRPLSVEASNWGPSQPNNYEGDAQNCLSSLPGNTNSKQQYLNDANCYEQCHYVCQLFTKTPEDICEVKANNCG